MEIVNMFLILFPNMESLLSFHIGYYIIYLLSEDSKMNRLKALRTQNDLKQTELANKLGVQSSAISKYENGQLEISNELLIKLADIFNVSTDYLLGRTDDPLPVRDIDQDLHDEHDYNKELEEFLKDNVTTAMFQDYGDWTEEEKRDLLQFLKGQKALREQNKGN